MVGRANTASVQPSQMNSVFQRSNLEGKLLNLVTELNQKEELQDGLLKAIVSGEMMSVERKYHDVREIEPFAKHIILTNHLPRISDYSDWSVPPREHYSIATAVPWKCSRPPPNHQIDVGAGCNHITRARRARAAH